MHNRRIKYNPCSSRSPWSFDFLEALYYHPKATYAEVMADSRFGIDFTHFNFWDQGLTFRGGWIRPDWLGRRKCGTRNLRARLSISYSAARPRPLPWAFGSIDMLRR